ncbi:MAG: DNA primase [Oscillospiraceae bacterium]|nr:DNA primase [Oscillospiraceae bacterium]
MRLFDAVKQSVTTLQAAQSYGIEIKRGMCLCPFHKEKTPSAKVDERFHCFGCGADYSVIDFTAELFGLSPVEAAKKLAFDFGVPYDDANYRPTKEERERQRAIQKQRENSERFDALVKRCFVILRDYYHLLILWRKKYAPKTVGEEFDPRFERSLAHMDFVDWALDVLNTGTAEEKSDFILEHGKGVLRLEERIFELAGESAC